MDIALEISLPDRSFPGSVVPDPDQIIGSARTLVFFEGSDRFGPSTPTVDGRAIAETLGVKLQYIFPAKAKLEDILLFFVSALFGIGSTFLVEGLLAYRNAKTAASRSRKV